MTLTVGLESMDGYVFLELRCFLSDRKEGSGLDANEQQAASGY